MPPTPFTLHVSDAALTDLKTRLASTRWPSTVDDATWSDGMPVAYARELAEAWANEFDWRKFEARVNALPNYTCRVAPPSADLGSVDLHFVHVKSSAPNVIPLLLLHGWPGSFIEFLNVIAPLTAPPHGDDDTAPTPQSFHVIVPSLPGYGLSSAPSVPGWGMATIADVLHSLMIDHLGYSRYCVQGGDWGGIIGAALARRHGASSPSSGGVVAFHTNLPLGAPALASPLTLLQAAAGVAVHRFGAPPWVAAPVLTPDELEGLAAGAAYDKHESGYFKIQSTRPRTLAFGLSDSPAGTLAWVVEKFYAWSDRRAVEAALPPGAPPGAAVEGVFGRDELLANASLYWFGRGDGAPPPISSSVRLYKEATTSSSDVAAVLAGAYCPVPTAALIAPRELFRPPRTWVAARNNVVRWTRLEAGGHFLALEAPSEFVKDVRSFLGEWGKV